MRNAWLAAINCNVFTVDWGVGAQNPNYITARNHVNLVGTRIAAYIDWLNAARGQAFGAVSIAGHSLGAHCAGAAGKRTTRGRVQSLVFSYSKLNQPKLIIQLISIFCLNSLVSLVWIQLDRYLALVTPPIEFITPMPFMLKISLLMVAT